MFYRGEKMDIFEQFSRHQYINLETFRKNGAGVLTPVWFVQDGDTFFVRTVANSGKVKRIHNNARVNIAACKVDGTLLGEWVSADAHEVINSDISRKVDQLLDRKYGLLKKMFAMVSALQGRKYTLLSIKVSQ